MSKIAILGYGVVGSGVYDVIRMNADSIFEKTGKTLDIKYILDIHDFPKHPEKHLFTKNFDDILNDSEIEIVAEVIGGITPAYDFTKKCLMSGKSVVTSNKELVAECGAELMSIAEKNGCCYLFEASVGGGIPIIYPLHRSMTANKINKIYGILNGTTNYILTQMSLFGKDFASALKEAQKNGYAEANPAADVEGIDAQRKIAILSNVAWGCEVSCKNIPNRGITDISLSDITFAKSLGGAIKLIGYSQKLGDKITAFVEPMLVLNSNPLYFVNDVFNAVVADGNATGNVMFYGKGAGKNATASAVVADIINIATGEALKTPISWKSAVDSYMTDAALCLFKYYVRADISDESSAKNAFENADFVSRDGETAFVTGELSEKEFLQKLSQLENVKQILKVMI